MDFRPQKRSRRNEVTVEITPLVDVVFLLLIFFAVTTSFVNSPGIEVDLPKAASSDMPSQMDDIVVAVNDAGEVIFENRRVSLEELTVRFEELAKDRKNSTVIVQADERTHHGTVVQVMDAAKEAGFARLAIATRR